LTILFPTADWSDANCNLCDFSLRIIKSTDLLQRLHTPSKSTMLFIRIDKTRIDRF
ncbi:MAG: hypothetical protein ACJAYZ_001555, partial [Bacteroidia bacterium]